MGAGEGVLHRFFGAWGLAGFYAGLFWLWWLDVGGRVGATFFGVDGGLACVCLSEIIFFIFWV